MRKSDSDEPNKGPELPVLVHLEQRLAGRAPRRLTPAMTPERLLALLDGMGLALDLDSRL